MTWKRDFASGLVVLLPILVTMYVVYWVFVRLAGVAILTGAVQNPLVGVFLTLLVFVLVVLAIGYLMRTALGTITEEYIDNLFNRLPGLRVVYNASKMGVQTALSGTSDLQTPVKLEPWGDLRMTAFKTGKKAPDGRDILFLPTAPNITSGYVIEVEPSEYEELDERVEEALTRILSAGFGGADQRDLAETLVGDEEQTDG